MPGLRSWTDIFNQRRLLSDSVCDLRSTGRFPLGITHSVAHVCVGAGAHHGTRDQLRLVRAYEADIRSTSNNRHPSRTVATGLLRTATVTAA